eukprot:TRINITY_DN2304_c0_g1_i1.p1 TRINITY_DN2304_c0_g1~~TRINITY_DN2304_c0_g1_i1.p1  ORF type:complete len:211 (+),score=30.38 TRINITY_DN2304_c0_g1_i1:92-724(+)
MDLPIEDTATNSQKLRARQALCTVVVVYLCWEYWAGSGDMFQWHPICMTVGYMALMAEGTSIGRRISKARGLVERKNLIENHMWVFSLCFVLVGVGFAIIYRGKELKNKPHLTSWHGQVGFTAGIAMLLQTTLGFSLYYQLPAKLNLSPSVRSMLRPLHLYLAIASSVLGVVALSFGFYTNYAVIKFDTYMRAAFALVAVLFHGLAFARC